MSDHAISKMRLRRSYPLFVVLASIVALLVACFWGIPVPKAGRVERVRSLVVGSYSPSDRILVPTKVISNIGEVSGYMERIAAAPQRLALPTLGTLRGPVVMLDQNGDPVIAVFFQSEHKALVFYNVRKADGGFEIMNEILVLGGALQRVFSYNLFDDASGKWQMIDTQDTSFQPSH